MTNVDPQTSAPGKIMLAGEYVVLDGVEAVLMAVNRLAFARIDPEQQRLSEFLAAARDVVASELGADSPAAHRAGRVVVNTTALYADDGTKLGLGSSAAATVAAIACAVGADDRALVHRLAHLAHRRAQKLRGAAGSGVDVAASTWGGILGVIVDPDPDLPGVCRPLSLPPGVALVPVWTGTAAPTGPLVAAVRAFRDLSPAVYDDRASGVSAAACALIDACVADDAAGVVAAVAAGGRAIAALGVAAAVELETDAHRVLRQLAEPFGGAIKPTGAGAGDIAIAAFSDPDSVEPFVCLLTTKGMTRVSLDVETAGVSSALVSHDLAD